MNHREFSPILEKTVSFVLSSVFKGKEEEGEEEGDGMGEGKGEGERLRFH